MKKKILVTGCTMLALLILTSCTGDTTSSQTADSASTTLAESSSTEAAPTAAIEEKLPVATQYEGVGVTPVRFTASAGSAADAELMTLFQTVYSNACVACDWMLNPYIAYDENDTLDGYPQNITYARVTGVDSMESLRVYLTRCFSISLLEKYVYPQYFEGETPKFLEKDGTLYVNIQTGGALQQAPHYQDCAVTDKEESAFTVVAPMGGPDGDVLETYAYKVIEQDGYWVLDSFYFFDGKYFTA